MRFLFLAILFVPALAAAHDGIRVSDAWAPPSLSQRNGVGFMTLNAGSNDALVGVASDCCEAVEMHNMTMDGDVMRMRRVKRIALPDHENVALESGGYHLMLIGLKEPLDAGDSVPLTLTFRHAPSQDVVLKVKQKPKAAQDHGHAGHY